MDLSVDEKIFIELNYRFPEGDEQKKNFANKIGTTKVIGYLLEHKINIYNLLQDIEYSYKTNKSKAEEPREYKSLIDKKTRYNYPFYRLNIGEKINELKPYKEDNNHLKSIINMDNVNEITKTKEKYINDIKNLEDIYVKMLRDCDVLIDKYRMDNYWKNGTKEYTSLFDYLEEFISTNF